MAAKAKASLKVKDLGWDAFNKQVKAVAKLGDPHVQVGLVGPKAEASYPGGGYTVAQVGAVHEFGAPDVGIPERSFIRSTFDKKRPEIVRLGRKLMKQVFPLSHGKGGSAMPMEKALGIMGAFVAAEVKKTISVDGVPPPLKQATIDRKGSDRTLVDTSRMLNSITWAVVTGKKED